MNKRSPVGVMRTIFYFMTPERFVLAARKRSCPQASGVNFFRKVLWIG